MRPLKLTLTAFGPYHETEIIDFEALKPYDLFVISGNTGAGKTSIFDGISYALFGGASGEDRKEATSLRSDFAPDELPTSAELLFSLRGKAYRVFRQLPYTKSGNKSQTPGKAELYEIDLESNDLFAEVSAVDRHITSEVDRKILELIGLNKAQFNQLVMLPQGEYQRFLTSSTNEKEAILRTVFNTEKYQTLITNLKMKRDAQNDRVIRLSGAQSQLLQSLFTQLPARDSLLFSYQKDENGLLKKEIPVINPHQALSGLAIEATYYEENLQKMADNITLKKYTIQDLQTTIAKAESINQAFTQLEATQQALQKAQAQEAVIQKARKSLELAEQAEPIAQPFETLTRLRADAKIAMTKLKTSEAELAQITQIAAEASKQHALEIAKEHQRSALSKEIIMLESNQPRVAALAKLQTEHQNFTTSYEDLSKQLAVQKGDIDTQANNRAAQTITLETTEKAAMPAFQLTNYLQKLSELKTILIAQDEKQVALIQAQEALINDQKLAETAQQQFDLISQNWLTNQAQLLAQSLQSGDPCPVCGSCEHPAIDGKFNALPHSADNESDQQALTQAQTTMIATNAQYQQSQLQVKQLSKELLKSQQQSADKYQEIQHFYQSEEADLLSSFQFPKILKNTDLIELNALITQVNEAKESSNKSHQMAIKQRMQLKVVETELTALREKFEKTQEAQRQLETTLTTKNAEIAAITAMIPKALQDVTVFQQNLDQQKKALSLLNSALDAALLAKTENDQKLAVLTNQVAHEKSAVDNLVNAGIEARKMLDLALIEAGFITKDDHGDITADESAFIAARLMPSEMRMLRETIQHYDQQIEVLKQQIIILEAQLKDQTTTDLSKLKTTLQEEETALQVLNESAISAKHALKTIKQATEKIQENAKSLEKERSYLQKIIEVHDLLRGDNPQKLSFERFILIAYFEQVIDAANLRLQQMTNGQFEFIRSENLASHGKQSGLDLDIYDAYTGEARDVKTLSGGEKFKASLSLSLGMADTIQSHQGGISIDTLFIDEGFGSLDEESLLQALDVLIDLQNSGKMIGVISHVEELKQTLPARIEVTKTKGGFSKTKIITQDSQ